MSKFIVKDPDGAEIIPAKYDYTPHLRSFVDISQKLDKQVLLSRSVANYLRRQEERPVSEILPLLVSPRFRMYFQDSSVWKYLVWEYDRYVLYDDSKGTLHYKRYAIVPSLLEKPALFVDLNTLVPACPKCNSSAVLTCEESLGCRCSVAIKCTNPDCGNNIVNSCAMPYTTDIVGDALNSWLVWRANTDPASLYPELVKELDAVISTWLERIGEKTDTDVWSLAQAFEQVVQLVRAKYLSLSKELNERNNND